MVDNYHDPDGQQNRREPIQFVINLPKRTQSSILLLLIDYVENYEISGNSILAGLDVYTAKQLVLLADTLKMRALEKLLLTVVLMQKLDRDTVMDFLNLSHKKVEQKSLAYRNEEVFADSDDDDGMMDVEEENQSNNSGRIQQIDIPLDEMDKIESIKDSEESWTIFNNYCTDLTANNLHYIMKQHHDEFTKNMKEDVISNVISKAIHFYSGDTNYDNRPLVDLLAKIRKRSSVFDLLKQEREIILEDEIKFRQETTR